MAALRRSRLVFIVGVVIIGLLLGWIVRRQLDPAPAPAGNQAATDASRPPAFESSDHQVQLRADRTAISPGTQVGFVALGKAVVANLNRTARGVIAAGTPVDIQVTSGSLAVDQVSVTMAYDPALIPAGLGDKQVGLAVFDTNLGAWVPILGARPDPAKHTVTGMAPHFSWFSPIVLDPLKAIVNAGGKIVRTLIDATVTIARWTLDLAAELAVELGKDLLGIAPQLRCAKVSQDVAVETSSLLSRLSACTDVADSKNVTLRLRNGFAFPVRTEKLPDGIMLGWQDTFDNGADLANLVRNLFWMTRGQVVVGGAALGRMTVTPAMKASAAVTMELDGDALAFDMVLAVLLVLAPETTVVKAAIKKTMQAGVKTALKTTGWLKATSDALECTNSAWHGAKYAKLLADPFSKASVQSQAEVVQGCLGTILGRLDLKGAVTDLIASVKTIPALLQTVLYPVAISLGEQLGIYQHKPPAATVRRTSREALFAGHWAVHGLTLDIAKNGSGTMQWNAGPCTSSLTETRMCAGNAKIKFTPGPNGRLDGVYTQVWYLDSDGRRVGDYEYAADGDQVGQRFWLARNPADKTGHTLISGGGSADDPDGPGNPYLCDEHASDNPANNGLCGA